MEGYCIVRFYQKTSLSPRKVIRRGLTLEEAQAWCQDPETSSSTCTSSAGRAHTDEHGPWFDGYTEE